MNYYCFSEPYSLTLPRPDSINVSTQTTTLRRIRVFQPEEDGDLLRLEEETKVYRGDVLLAEGTEINSMIYNSSHRRNNTGLANK